MNTRRLRAPAIATSAVLALLCTSCTSGGAAVLQPPPPSTSTSTADPALTGRPSSELRKGLLTAKDVPAGKDPSASSELTDRGTASSSRSECRPLVRLLNAKALPGSVSQARVALSGGERGPFVEESLHDMGSSAAAGAGLSEQRDAIQRCDEVTVSYPSTGDSRVRVEAIPFPRIDDGSHATRFRADSGPLDGFELTRVWARTGQLVVGLTFVATDQEDAEAAAKQAVRKARLKLGAGSAT